jgi:hypothetical protein
LQSITETISLWNNAYDALCEAQSLVEQLEKETSRILDDNTEPIRVPTDYGTSRTITTPDDLNRLHYGTVISVSGSEFMRTGYSNGPWTDMLGIKKSNDRLFRHMLGHAGECEIVHMGN